MTKTPKIYLEDIIQSSDLIAKYITGKSKDDFDHDEQLQDAVIRRLEIIGEAVKRLPSDFRDHYPQIDWKGATGMRDILIHLYDEVDTGQVWVTIVEVLPSFAKKIRQIVDETQE